MFTLLAYVRSKKSKKQKAKSSTPSGVIDSDKLKVGPKI